MNSKNLRGTFKGEPFSASFKPDHPQMEYTVLATMHYKAAYRKYPLKSIIFITVIPY